MDSRRRRIRIADFRIDPGDRSRLGRPSKSFGKIKELLNPLLDDVQTAVPELRLCQIVPESARHGIFGLTTAGSDQKLANLLGELVDLIAQPVDSK